ncbi:MAG: 50S ribosomal protein L10 [Bdellovibrionales bacterium]|nr:50S ribosomal protein L10 [Bdellovibrionales bacterium]
MDRTNKTELATELKTKFEKAKVAIFADYKGLKALEADELRKALRAKGTEVKVLKNNIGRLIAKDGVLGEDGNGVMDRLVGPTLVAFAYEDPAAAAKVINNFAKDHEALKIKEGLLGKKLLRPADVTALAELPSKEVLLAQLLGVLNGPARSFVTVLAAVPRGLVTALSAIEKKKAEGGQQ